METQIGMAVCDHSLICPMDGSARKKLFHAVTREVSEFFDGKVYKSVKKQLTSGISSDKIEQSSRGQPSLRPAIGETGR